MNDEKDSLDNNSIPPTPSDSNNQEGGSMTENQTAVSTDSTTVTNDNSQVVAEENISSTNAATAQPSFLDSIKVYKDWRMAKILLIGSMSGFPWILIASMMSLWLKSEGLSRSGIGFFGIVFTVYAFNLFWAPIVDSVKIPFLHKLGQRRSWITLMQILIVICMFGMSFFNPSESLVIISFLAFFIALSSATMDVAIDAFRIELIGTNERSKVGAGSAMATSGWWLGFGGLGAVGLVLAEYLEMTVEVEKFWPVTYALMTFVPIISVILMFLFIAEPKREAAQAVVRETGDFNLGSVIKRFFSIWINPVASFVKNYGIKIGIMILILVFLFKVGEAFLGRMSIIFYKEIGFSKGDIALYSKGYGTLALCVFAVLGSLINARYGLYRGLLIGGIAMASTNLLFAVLAHYPLEWLFGFAVIVDQFTTAFSTVALVAFLSQLCDRAYAATQYAALASIGNFSRTTLAVFSGVVVDSLGGNWSVFFILTTIMVIPSLAMLIYIRKDIAHIMEGKTTKFL